MKVTARGRSFVIVDDLLPSDQMRGIWLDLQKEVFSSRNITDHYNKLWRLGNSLPVSSPSYKMSQPIPADLPYIPLMAEAFRQIAEMFPDLIEQSTDLRLHVQLFTRGVKIGWHVDSHSVGSFTYYPHPEWSANWGGELFIPEGVGPVTEPLPASYDFRFEEDLLNHGFGFFGYSETGVDFDSLGH